MQGASFSLLILGAWIALGVIFVGVGALFRRACRSPIANANDWLQSFWLGWVCTLFALQLWQLVFPADVRALVTIAVAGGCGFLVSGGTPWRQLGRGVLRCWPAVVLLLLVAAWLSNLALGGARNGDSGMYHIPTVRWLAEYPIVLGLGNLHRHLAFNQSYFLYVAMLDVGPFWHHSHHLANGLLGLALLARIVLGLSRVLRLRRPCPADDLFYALFLPGAVIVATSINLTSPAPDFPIFVLGIVISGELIAFLSRRRPQPAPDLNILAITLLAVGGVTVKLSFGGLAGMMLPLAILLWLWRDRPRRESWVATLAAVAAVGAIGMGPWVVRGILLSGYPAFPSPFAPLPVAWRVPLDIAIAQANSTRVWSMVPGAWRAALGDPRWFGTWLVSLGWTDRGVLLPIEIGGAAIFIGLCRRVITWRARRPAPVSALILLPTIASFVYCFVAGPFPRYAAATFWLFAVQGVLVALSSTVVSAGQRARIVIPAAALLLAGILVSDDRALLRPDLTGLEVSAHVQLRQVQLQSGLVVGVPVSGDQCWDAPLPCAPPPSPALRLRRAGDIGAGFMMDPSIRRDGGP